MPGTTPNPHTLAQRRIVQRTRGREHGPITRLVSPGDLGQVLKPFIFLDRFEAPAGGQPPAVWYASALGHCHTDLPD